MDLVEKTTDNGILRRKVEEVRRKLMDGEGLSGPMTNAGAIRRF